MLNYYLILDHNNIIFFEIKPFMNNFNSSTGSEVIIIFEIILYDNNKS